MIVPLIGKRLSRVSISWSAIGIVANTTRKHCVVTAGIWITRHTCCANSHSYNWVGRWVTCVDLHTNKLVSSSYDGTVRVWNTQTGNCLQTLPGDANNHEGLSPVWCCKFKGSHIMAGSSDSKIRQWDMNTGQMVRVFEAHAGGVKCLQVC
jgi:WD40 repeat protein